MIDRAWSELQAAIQLGDMEDIEEIVSRFGSLPEWGMERELERIYEQIRRVAEIEEQAKLARRGVRTASLNLLAEVQRLWTPEEISEATGYCSVEEGHEVEVGDAVEFGGERWIAVLHNNQGLLFQPTKKDGTAHKGRALQKILPPYKILTKARP